MSNMVVQTNVLSLNSHRNLKTVGSKQANASARLSSGYKINSAADDAAGLAISEKMRAQIRGLDMASKNAQDGISLIQTAEGGMQEINNMLQRVRELVDQAANDTNENNTEGTGDRHKIQDEINQLVEEIDSMADRVEFNKKKVIDGSFSDVTKQLADAKNALTNAKSSDELDNVLSALASIGTPLASVAGKYNTAIGTLSTAEAAYDQALSTANAQLAKAEGAGVKSAADIKKSAAKLFSTAGQKNSTLGQERASHDALKNTFDKLEKTFDSLTAKLQGGNLKIEALSTKVAALEAQLGNGDSLYFQIGANASQGIEVNIGSVKSDVLGIGNGNGGNNIDILQDSGKDITGYLDVLDVALSYVTTERSKLGASQNRLDYTMKSLDISSENLSAAESRIRDTDMAKEMMNMTKSNVLQQAATSMLAQANQAPQSVLQLLG